MMKLKFPTVMILTFAVGIFSWVAYYFLLPGQGPPLEEWETSNGSFKVRVVTRKELYAYMPRQYYVFQSSSGETNEWDEITTLVFDDPQPLPRDQVRFVNERVGYFFMASTYAVTRDGGHTWSVFNVRKDPPLGTTDSYLTIKGISIAPDGTGVMTLYSKLPGEAVPELHTLDYGQHWNVK